jgi:hypothetical protein
VPQASFMPMSIVTSPIPSIRVDCTFSDSLAPRIEPTEDPTKTVAVFKKVPTMFSAFDFAFRAYQLSTVRAIILTRGLFGSFSAFNVRFESAFSS